MCSCSFHVAVRTVFTRILVPKVSGLFACVLLFLLLSLDLFLSRRLQVCNRALFVPPFACQEKARRGLALCRCTITSHQFRPQQQACVKPAVHPWKFCLSEETSQAPPLLVDNSVPAHTPKKWCTIKPSHTESSAPLRRCCWLEHNTTFPPFHSHN